MLLPTLSPSTAAGSQMQRSTPISSEAGGPGPGAGPSPRLRGSRAARSQTAASAVVGAGGGGSRGGAAMSMLTVQLPPPLLPLLRLPAAPAAGGALRGRRVGRVLASGRWRMVAAAASAPPRGAARPCSVLHRAGACLGVWVGLGVGVGVGGGGQWDAPIPFSAPPPSLSQPPRNRPLTTPAPPRRPRAADLHAAAIHALRSQRGGPGTLGGAQRYASGPPAPQGLAVAPQQRAAGCHAQQHLRPRLGARAGGGA